MSRVERGFGRDWHWSVFHRSMPPPARMIDIDTLEHCQYCKESILVIEAARDNGQSDKPTSIVYKLAKKANIMAFLVFYKPEIIDEHVDMILGQTEQVKRDKNPNEIPALTEPQLAMLWKSLETETFKVVRMRQLYPKPTAYSFTPREFYDFISLLRRKEENENDW